MRLSEAVGVLRKWLWLPVLLGLIAGGTAAWVSTQMTPIYQSTAAVLVRPAQAGSQAGLQPVDQVAKTYAQLMTKRPLVQQVIDELYLRYSTEELQANISVSPEKDTELLDVKVQDPDPKQAALIANTLVQDFIAQNEAQEQQQIKSSLASLQARIDELEQQITNNSRAIALLQAKPRPTPDDQAQLTNLQERKAADSTTYATLFKNYQDLRSSQLARYETLAVVDPAIPGKRPIKPNKVLNTLLAGSLGAMLAVGLILLIEYLDDSLKTEEDVRRYLGVPVLGNLIFRKTGREGELITLTEPMLPASEAFRTLRTNLLFSRVDRGLGTIVVASAVPGEGKTRTAANLAVSLAQTGQRCILVDADFRRPSLKRIFGLAEQRGLSDMILDTAIDPALIQATELPTLRVVLSGTPPPNPSELLGSQRMLRVVHELSSKADVVVFDTPPLNAVTDAALLAARLDATILVVEAGRTHRSAVLHAKEAIEKVGGSLAGVVLNKTRWRAQNNYNYYGYRSVDPVVPASPQVVKIPAPLMSTPSPLRSESQGGGQGGGTLSAGAREAK